MTIMCSGKRGKPAWDVAEDTIVFELDLLDSARFGINVERGKHGCIVWCYNKSWWLQSFRLEDKYRLSKREYIKRAPDGLTYNSALSQHRWQWPTQWALLPRLRVGILSIALFLSQVLRRDQALYGAVVHRATMAESCSPPLGAWYYLAHFHSQ